MRLITASTLIALLTGCATSAVTIDKAKPAPAERVLINNVDSKEAKITIIRDSGFMGGGCYVDVFLNDNLAAKLDTAEKVTFNIKSGELILGSKLSGSALCGGASIRHFETSISQGQHKLYRVMTDQNGNPQIISGGIAPN
ncbi:hypothetical protein [Shewanella xiamenensis]|uniref:hypothetical protein n=1 Tax=Shewanella xiamenensis TaxID=332186 RepID=UPI00217F0D82|nr:hypothetical protein [Shewanella xiamenensis]MCT8871580.1 hypothetical protein [Shewanella xiamenensis]UWH43581.1 hypothetical protein KXJ80_10255 [Shewanella xiamenensis]